MIIILAVLSQQALSKTSRSEVVHCLHLFYTLCSFKTQLDLEGCDDEVETEA